MKTSGIVRKIDPLGRVVIPKELRKIKGISSQDEMEIFVEEDRIILKKKEERCIFCGNVESDMIQFKGKYICKSCKEYSRSL